MSDEPTTLDEEQPQLYRALTLSEPGAWYWLGTMFPYLLRSIAFDLNLQLVPFATNSGYGTQCEVSTHGHSIGTIVFNRPGPGASPGAALMWNIDPEYAAFWDQVGARIQAAQHQARNLRRTHEGMSPDEAIEVYYRAKAAGSRATLRNIAEQYHHNYDYLRKVKRQYDAEGKWGSKKEPTGSRKNEE